MVTQRIFFDLLQSPVLDLKLKKLWFNTSHYMLSGFDISQSIQVPLESLSFRIYISIFSP